MVLDEGTLIVVGSAESPEALIQISENPPHSVEVFSMQRSSMSYPVPNWHQFQHLCPDELLSCQEWQEQLPQLLVEDNLEQRIERDEPQRVVLGSRHMRMTTIAAEGLVRWYATTSVSLE